jgi:hypothetical protein
MPGYGTVYDLVREVPSSLLTLAHQGSKAYSEGYDFVHRSRETSAKVTSVKLTVHSKNILIGLRRAK